MRPVRIKVGKGRNSGTPPMSLLFDFCLLLDFFLLLGFCLLLYFCLLLDHLHNFDNFDHLDHLDHLDYLGYLDHIDHIVDNLDHLVWSGEWDEAVITSVATTERTNNQPNNYPIIEPLQIFCWTYWTFEIWRSAIKGVRLHRRTFWGILRAATTESPTGQYGIIYAQ